MNWLSELGRRLQMLLRRDEFDSDLEEEMKLHIQMRVDQQIKEGVSEKAAQAAARRQFGNVLSLREQSQDAWGWRWLEQLVQDVRYGIRTIFRAPGFATITVLTLALGIGGTTAIFSAVYPILFQPLPYPNSDRITMIWEIGREGKRDEGTFGMYRELAERNQSYDSIAEIKPWQPTMTGVDQPERLDGQRVSATYFKVLGIAPALGRDFQQSEDQLNGASVAILSDSLWRRRFGADPDVVGRKARLDDKSFTIIGVMPNRFENVLDPTAELWTTLQYDMSQGRAWGHHLRAVGRLRHDVTMSQAIAELNEIGQAVLEEQHPETYRQEVKFLAISLHDDVIRGVKPALMAIMAAVLLVLVIACVNVTNLLLARGVHRRGEFALRAALGAGRGRLLRQLLTESLLLAAFGGLVGIIIADFGVHALVSLSPPGLPRVNAIAINYAVFVFGIAITTLIGVAFGLIPALHASRRDPNGDLQYGSPRSAGGHRRTRNSLVIVEVALALVLLVSSGLLLRSLQRLFAVDTGFDSSRLLTMLVQTSTIRFSDKDAINRFFEQSLEAVKRVPGVSAAAFTSQLPMSGDSDLYGVQFDPVPLDDPGEIRGTFRYAISPDYLELMRIPLKSGRYLEEHDGSDAPLVAVISESLVKRRLKGLDPLGQRLRIGTGPLYTVVGVVGDVRQVSLALSEPDAVYTTASQWRSTDNSMSLVVRARNEAMPSVSDLRRAIWSVDKDQPVLRVRTMDDLLAASAEERRFALIVFEAFAAAALVLAAAGLYGVLSGSVAERTREFGVRLALGASRESILSLVVRQGLILTGLGIAIGLAGAVASSQALVSMLYGITSLDPVTYFGVVLVLTVVSILACAVPAWRAVNVDPAITLRAE
ncbi:MAG TPA: ABC transporter permease [Blastocatellia bacterium]|nr:ABC transporter permease [Blastocatellia bacterium]